MSIRIIIIIINYFTLLITHNWSLHCYRVACFSICDSELHLVICINSTSENYNYMTYSIGELSSQNHFTTCKLYSIYALTYG